MKNLYKTSELEILIPENYEDNLSINHNWCTSKKEMYDFHANKMNQTLFRIIYNDGYILSIGVNKNDFTNGHWIDNVIENNKPTFIYLVYLKGNIFDWTKIKDIATKHNNQNLLNMAIKISELPENAKNSILNELK